MDRTRVLAGAALAGMALAAGCNGGGAGNPIPHATTLPASTVKFTITVPLTSADANARRPQFEAPSGTQSVSFQLTSVNGAAQTTTPTVVNTSSSASGCTSANNALTCTASVPGIAGTDVFTITSYSQPDAKGTAIASGNAQVTTSAGTTTDAPVTLSGSVASITLSFPGIGVLGQAGTLPLLVIAKDTKGATIMGTYSTPITLADSDASGATKLSTTTVNDSTQASQVTMSYDGSAISSATISASATGISSANITNATFKPNNDFAAVNGSTLTYAVSASATSVDANGSPSPMQTASATMQDAYTTGATFAGNSNAIKVNQLMIQATPAPLSAQSVTTQSIGFLFFGGNVNFYYAVNPTATGATVNQIGWEEVYDPATNTDNSKDQAVATGAGFQIAQLPFKAGNSWNSAAGYAETYSYDTTVYDGTQDVPATYKDAYNAKADGSYTDNSTLTSNDGKITTENDSSTVNPDATVSETDNENGDIYTMTIGKPVPAPSGSPSTTSTVIPITETYTSANATPGPSATPTVKYVPNWYPNGQAPSPLTSDKDTDKGSVAIPQQCNVPSSTATSAEQIHEDYSSFDPYGYVETDSNDFYYVGGIGLVCSVQHWDWSDYNFYQGTFGGHEVIDFAQGLTATQLQSALRRASSMNDAGSIAGEGLQTSLLQHHLQVRKQLQSMRTRHVTQQFKSLKRG